MLFSALPPDMRSELRINASSRTFSDGQMIQQRGDEADGFWLVETGSVAVGQFLIDGEFRAVGLLGPGDSYGELALFSGRPRVVDAVAREVGLSRPHFYKLFREQIGLTPNLYLNALRMERAIERLAVTQEAVSDIGFDLGYSSQASFSRFFIANGVVPPSAYRRSIHVA